MTAGKEGQNRRETLVINTPESDTTTRRMYDDVLIPTDGSKGVERAVEHGLDIAQKYDATVHALYVVDTSYSFTGAWDSLGNALKKRGEEATKKIAEQGEEMGVEVERETDIGVPHKIILEYAKNDGIDLIVMGTHGKSRIGEVIIGSVTQRVVRKSEVPVLTVRMLPENVEESQEEEVREEESSRLSFLRRGDDGDEEDEVGEDQEDGDHEDEEDRDEDEGGKYKETEEETEVEGKDNKETEEEN